MKLRKKQREYLLQLIAEGLQISEINERAAKFKPRFKVTPQQVDYYRQSRGLALETIQEADESDALKTGLAIRDNRVKQLKQLADILFDELTRENNLIWTENAKAIGTERYDFLEFNKAEIDVWRGLLDDIAKEVGERRPETQNNNTFNFFNLDEWKKNRAGRLKEVAELETD